MALPLRPPLLPQLARPRSALPTGDGWAYEPKWDGFRTVAFVDGDDVYLQSRNGRPLRRYFPEVTFPQRRCVLDGELVIFTDDGGQDFDLLGQRLHPADSRVRMLAEKTPARFIAFDLLADGDEVLLELPQRERRDRLEALLADGGCDLTPTTEDPAAAEPWLRGAEGVIAKEQAAPYRPGERVGMVKIKRVRTIDAVVIGWRPGKEPDTVGSLILGLYDGDQLREVGHTSGLNAKQKRELVATLKPYETGERFVGEPSRWQTARDLEWVVLRPELVIEVSFDHVSNGRIRHGSKIVRWREDKDPRDCAIAQLAQ